MQDGGVNPQEKKADGLRLFSVDSDAPSTEKPAEHVGRRLRAAREARGRTIEDCAADLKIRADYLRALEDLDFDRLPSMAYAGPFARSYAKALGVDELAVLHEVREHAPRPKTEEAFTPPPGFAPRPARTLYLGLAFALTLAVGAGWMVTYDRARDPDTASLASVSVERPSDVAAPTPAPERAPDAAVSESSADEADDPGGDAAPVTEASVENGADDTVAPPPDAAPPDATVIESGDGGAGASAPVSADPPETDEIVADDPAPRTPPRPRTRPERIAASPDAATPEPPPASVPSVVETANGAAVPDLPAGRRFGATDAAAAVSIRALRPAWLRIEDGDGRVTFSGNLGVGDRFFAPYGRGYIATVRDAGAFDAFAGARYLGVLGREGQPLPTVEIDVLGNS